MKKKDYTIKIENRGETVIYHDATGDYYFDFTYMGKHPTLHASTYWDGNLEHQIKTLLPPQRELIIGRIVDHFKNQGVTIVVSSFAYEDQLPEHYKK